MIRCCALFCLLIAFGACAVVPNAAEQKQPNVIVILSDDQGYGDIGIYGGSDILTPNIDALAKDGVRFTQFYAGAPLCSPSRASLMTGLASHRSGVPTNVSVDPDIDGMPSSKRTIAEALKDEGYRTALIGKWHLGASPATRPMQQGFDYHFGHIAGVIDNYSHTNYWEGLYHQDLWKNGERIFRNGEYFPDLMIEEATNFIDADRSTPFFLYFAVNLPHYPYQGDPEWLTYYEQTGISEPRLQYAAFVTSMDQRIGQLLDHLKATGRYEDTIVIFQTDHGFSTEQRANYGGGSAGIYRGAKFSLFEGGIRVPSIIAYSKMLPKAETRDQLALSVDWFPTILDMLAMDSRESELDGSSLLPVLLNMDTPSPHNSYVWRVNESVAVRRGDWKLLVNPVETSPLPNASQRKIIADRFLVNLKLDPSEKTNIAEMYPEIVDELMELIRLDSEQK